MPDGHTARECLAHLSKCKMRHGTSITHTSSNSTDGPDAQANVHRQTHELMPMFMVQCRQPVGWFHTALTVWAGTGGLFSSALSAAITLFVSRLDSSIAAACCRTAACGSCPGRGSGPAASAAGTLFRRRRLPRPATAATEYQRKAAVEHPSPMDLPEHTTQQLVYTPMRLAAIPCTASTWEGTQAALAR